MSYKRVLHSSVDYRKSITVSYPASEHGGSKQATVEGTIPIDITVHVDTNAFDSSISRCNGQIGALTDSVVVMNSAQCEAIAESARNISDHITGGFFSMIKSEISQNMAALFGKITSGIGLILEKVRFIQQQRAIMESDYNRTKARYVKLFHELDEEYRQRVIELDKKAFELASEIRNGTLSQAKPDQAVSTVLGIQETGTTGALFAGALLKSRTLRLMNAMQAHITDQLAYSKTLETVLYPKKVSEITGYSVPVVFAESDSFDDAQLKAAHCYVSGVFGTKSAEIMSGAVQNYFASHTDVWETSTASEENNSIANYFNTLAEQMRIEYGEEHAEQADRVYETLMQLRKQSPVLTNKKF